VIPRRTAIALASVAAIALGALFLLPFVVVATLLGSVGGLDLCHPGATLAAGAGVAAPAAGDWDAEQVRNAATIVQVASEMKLPTRAAVDAVAAAMQESGLRNLTYGDRDSLGLFQQRPSTGWGTPAQILDPVFAAAAFLRHLVQLPGWDQLPVGRAVQVVQRSADPSGQTYQRWADRAAQLVASITGHGVSGCASPDPTGTVKPGLPLACAPVVTQAFGPTNVSIEPPLDGYPHFHTGIDLACAAGTAVRALSDGVAHVTTGWGGGYGNNVLVEVRTRLPGGRDPGLYFLRYAHLADLAVGDGDRVTAGQLLGHEGSTGNSTGPHLHFEVDAGTPSATASVDPAPLIDLH
jgi:murein DD-endopeptidase MepM/ murein hydrolase activator NlpD